MASLFLLFFLSCICLSRLACTAAPPANAAPDQRPETPDSVAPINASAPQNLAMLNGIITFKIPGSQISLTFSKFSHLISQTELDICVIEGIGSLFQTVLARGKDYPLPLNSVDYRYGNVIVNVHSFSPPYFEMTYASVVSTLRGIALFTSLYGYFGMAFEVYDGLKGHVGTGDLGPIIPG